MIYMTVNFQGIIEIYTMDDNVFTGLFTGYSKYGIKLMDATDIIHKKMYKNLTVITSRIVDVKQKGGKEMTDWVYNSSTRYTQIE